MSNMYARMYAKGFQIRTLVTQNIDFQVIAQKSHIFKKKK